MMTAHRTTAANSRAKSRDRRAYVSPEAKVPAATHDEHAHNITQYQDGG